MRLAFSRHIGDACQTRTYAAAIRLCADGLDLDPIITRGRITAQELRGTIHRVHHNVNIAIVVEVSNGAAAGRTGSGDSRPGLQ